MPVQVTSPVQGTVVSVHHGPGDAVSEGTTLAVVESMKMEHVVSAPSAGSIRSFTVEPGDAVAQQQTLVLLDPDTASPEARDGVPPQPRSEDQGVRPDLAGVVERHRSGLDAARPEAVARREATGHRTARQNIDDLCDEGSFVEYGPVVIAAQRRRRSVDELIDKTPADGLVAGIGTVDGRSVVALTYDYTVLAGTQGAQNHRKKDRLFDVAERLSAPVVFFTEGGGGRPGDTDGIGMAGLDTMAFHLFARLSGQVPLIGIASGRCFAGNAALLGCCDVVIATRDANIGMGGPAMIEGGGLGEVSPDDIGPADTQSANGVIDVLVDDEAAAVAVAKRYLDYFSGPTDDWSCPDQTHLRTIVPENRVRAYDVAQVIETMADSDSVLEVRQGFARGIRTALARIEGHPLGIVANNPLHLGGAIDAAGADKAARFLQLCDAHDLPILYLCDTPGIMVGPEAEESALVRHVSRLFVTGANVSVPYATIVLRKAYGLGAQAMAGGSFKAPLFTVSWPTGEFGGMNLEGAVKLGYRRELDAIDDTEERQAALDAMVAAAYDHGRALNAATHFEFDDVIDPIDSRRWVTTVFAAATDRVEPSRTTRPNVDTW